MRGKKIASLLLAMTLGVSALTGCAAVNKNDTIATLGDKEIKAGVVNFMCRYQQASVEDYYVSALGEDPWSQDPYSSGTNMQDTLKNSVMESVREMYTVAEHLEDYNVALTEDEKAAIKSAAEKFMSDNDKAALAEMGATQEIVEEMLTLYTERQKMYDAIISEVDTNVSDEEANKRAYSILRVGIAGSYDEQHQYTEYTEEEKAEIITGIQAVSDKIQEPADLETVAQEAGYNVTQSTYDADDQLEEALRNALDGLKEGEISDVITSDNYAYIVRIDKDTDEEATAQNRESIIASREDTKYQEVLKAWEDELEWSVKESLVEKIQFKNSLTLKGEESESVETTEQ